MPNELPAAHGPSTLPAPRHAAGGRPPAVESLEGRQLLSVSAGAGGLTVVTPGGGSKVVYVSSSSGNDAGAGSSSAPVRTIKRAEALIRSGAGDQVLLKRGDTFRENFGFFKWSGAGSGQPTLVGAYGSGARPVVSSGGGHGMQIDPGVHDLVLSGIKFDGTGRGSANSDGIISTGQVTNVLVEDCEINGYHNDLTFQNFSGPINNIKIRRSVIVDAHSNSAHSQGIYAEGVTGLTLEENVFDHNGWGHGASATIFNHNAYIKENCAGFVARNNVFAEASAYGLQARGGGIVEGNVFLDNPIDMAWGLVTGAPLSTSGATGRITNNVYLGGRAAVGQPSRGFAIDAGNSRPGSGLQITGNVIAHAAAGTPWAIDLAYGNGQTLTSGAVGLNDVQVKNNIVYDWGRGLTFANDLQPGGSGLKAVNRVTVANNDFQRLKTLYVLFPGDGYRSGNVTFSGNRYDSAAGVPTVSSTSAASLAWTKWSPGHESGGQVVRVVYPDPNRTAASYAGSLGAGASNAAFIGRARQNSGGGWTGAFTAVGLAKYVRAGFGLGTLTPATSTPTPTPTSTPSPTPTPTSKVGSVTGLTLINAATDQAIGALKDGATVTLATVGKALNVRADATGTIGSVRFTLDGKTFSIEGGAPYALASNSGADYKSWTPGVGSHTLVATPFAGLNAAGLAGAGVTVRFTVK